jgi:uroporphyrinogen-III decarboxylase
MLWVQGEADSTYGDISVLAAQAYGKNLKNLVHSVRTHLKQPKLPFLLLQVGSDVVVEVMKSTAKEDANVLFIAQSRDKNSPYYLPQNPPPLWHYTTEGMKKIGLNFHSAFADHKK